MIRKINIEANFPDGKRLPVFFEDKNKKDR